MNDVCRTIEYLLSLDRYSASKDPTVKKDEPILTEREMYEAHTNRTRGTDHAES